MTKGCAAAARFHSGSSKSLYGLKLLSSADQKLSQLSQLSKGRHQVRRYFPDVARRRVMIELGRRDPE